jgi:hypothetical protein
MMTVSAISPSIRRMATTLVLSQPTLDVSGRLCLFLFLGCDPQHKPRRWWTNISDHWPHLHILRLAYFRLVNGCGAKRTRSHKVGIEPKWHGVKQRQLI